MRFRLAAPGLASAAALLAAACGGPGEPVARLGVEPPSLPLPYPGSGRLEAVWEMLEPLDEGAAPHVFIHLIEGPGIVLRTFDHPFPVPWRPGEEVAAPIEIWQSALAPPLAPGAYRLTVGLYDPESGRRWRLEAPGEEVDEGEYAFARVEVPAEAAAGPEVVFSESWGPLEPTADRQLFSVRWLGADGGRIAIEELEAPVTLGLTLSVLRHEEQGFRLLLDPGEEVPRVRVASDCGGEMATLEGFGSHELELPFAPDASRTACAVQVEPNFVYLDEATFARRSVRLDRLHWRGLRPAAGAPPQSPPSPE